jgi:hypothetical protein
MENAGIIYGHLEYLTIIWYIYFVVIWYILGHLVMLWKFGIFSLVLVHCVKKNLATLFFTSWRFHRQRPIFYFRILSWCD